MTHKNKGGRPEVVKKEIIQSYKSMGYSQEKIAQLLNVSLSTVKRKWK